MQLPCCNMPVPHDCITRLHTYMWGYANVSVSCCSCLEVEGPQLLHLYFYVYYWDEAIPMWCSLFMEVSTDIGREARPVQAVAFSSSILYMKRHWKSSRLALWLCWGRHSTVYSLGSWECGVCLTFVHLLAESPVKLAIQSSCRKLMLYRTWKVHISCITY